MAETILQVVSRDVAKTLAARVAVTAEKSGGATFGVAFVVRPQILLIPLGNVGDVPTIVRGEVEVHAGDAARCRPIPFRAGLLAALREECQVEASYFVEPDDGT